MADYYSLIARAVTGLDKRTGEARRALYERARTALVTQLRGVEPALSEADITRERLALEEAIRKVEGEAARRPRQETPESPRANAVPPPPRIDRPSAFAPAPPPPSPFEVRSAETPPPADWEELRRELNGLEPPPQPEGMEAPERKAHAPEPPAPPRNKRLPGQGTSLVDEGLKGFRDVIAETDDLGEATASASRSARETREAFAGLPPSNEPRRRSEQEHPPSSPRRPEPRSGARARPAPPPLAPEEFEEPQSEARRQPRQPLRPALGGAARKIIGFALVLVLAAAAFFAYREWGGSITGARSPAVQASKEAPPARPKISDRIGGAQQDSTTRAARNAGAAVAQRAVLYEQQSDPQERKQYVGSVIWRTETSSPGPGQPADVAVKAEVEIPERHMRMSFTMRRNLDQSLPASHTIEILFSTPADFQPGGIADVPGVLMEDTEQKSGTPLTGLRVKVTSGFFLVGLSSVENDVRRNVQLLKERAWLHLRMAYNNGQRALLAIEKGVPGDRVFEEALNAWGQTPPQQSQR
jgi:hypothetical protein